jgi:Zn-dependent protease
MTFKTKFCRIEIETMLIFIILTSIISNTLFKFLYCFFACYLFILFHELMHILVGNILNKKLIKIKFSIAGICASFEKEKYLCKKDIYFKNIIIYLSGPISNLILAYMFNSNLMIKEINIFLAVLNFLPLYPLDGYNIISNILKIIVPQRYVLKILNTIENVFIVIVLILSLYQIIEYYNFSIIIFCLYIFVLKINKKNN